MSSGVLGDVVAGETKGQNGAPHLASFKFSFKVLEMCRKVQELRSTQICM